MEEMGCKLGHHTQDSVAIPGRQKRLKALKDVYPYHAIRISTDAQAPLMAGGGGNN